MNTLLFPLFFMTLNTAANGDLICVTDHCKKISKRIKESLDESVPPCDDFYKFVCGNYLKNAVIPEKESYINSFLELEKNVDIQLLSLLEKEIHEDDIKPYKDAKKMYKLCKDEDKSEKEKTDPLKIKIKEAGGWPVLGNWNKKKFSILTTETTLYNVGLKVGSLFDLSENMDANDNTKIILTIAPPETMVPKRYLLKSNDDENYKKQLENHEKFMVKVAVELGADEKTAKSDMREVINFMIKMAQVMEESDEDTDSEDMDIVINLNDLQQHTEFIVWNDLLKELLPKTITEASYNPITVTDLKYIKQLGKFLKQYDARIIANYMVWYAIRDFTDTLTRELQKLIFSGYDIQEEDMRPRWKDCFGKVNSRFFLAISHQYLKEHFNMDSKHAVRRYIRSLRVYVIQQIEQTYNWLPEQARKMALSKTLLMRDKIGFPDGLINDEKLIEYYNGLNSDKATYFDSLVAYEQWRNKDKFRHLREFLDTEDWRYNGQIAEASATYGYTNNLMNFPAGFLQFPLYSDQVPKYINLAGFSQIVGNVFTRNFMDKLAELDDGGNVPAWWDAQSKETLESEKKCFVDQYSVFKCSQTGKQVDGTSTLQMNMADNGGIQLSFQIYKQTRGEHGEAKLPDLLEYTPEKLFWIAAANVWCTKVNDDTLEEWIKSSYHAPHEFRVNGVIMNSEHFSSTFQCGKTDKMNPETKCSVWS